MENKYSNYLKDLGTIAKEYAIDAIDEHKKSKETDSECFQAGYLMGLHRIITLMQQQAELFDIPLEDLGLEYIKEEEFLK